MKKTLATLVMLALILSYHATIGSACTTFFINDSTGNLVFGRNLDFSIGYGHVTVNKRNLEKTSLISGAEKPLTWVSKFGSITFNQAGKELPYGGMNEAGLVVEQMLLPNKSKYPDPDERFGLTALQWIQYQLDNSKTIQDIINSDSIIRVAYASQRSRNTLHFLVSDRSGDAAVIEYIDGEMKCYRGEELKYPVLANNTYEDSLANIKEYSGFGGDVKLPTQSESSLERFAIAAAMVCSQKEPGSIVDYSFDILRNVAQSEESGWPTQWSIVYDIHNLQIYYKTAKNSQIRKIALKDFDFGGSSPALFADIEKNVIGSADFDEYSTQANRELIEKANLIPRGAQERAATYPESIHFKEYGVINDEVADSENPAIL